VSIWPVTREHVIVETRSQWSGLVVFLLKTTVWVFVLSIVLPHLLVAMVLIGIFLVGRTVFNHVTERREG
jgi:hypothetical protein